MQLGKQRLFNRQGLAKKQYYVFERLTPDGVGGLIVHLETNTREAPNDFILII